ncbi:MAG: peptidoglycan DD-metalloendopeptidase family protein [Pseudomonadota bacterium]
MLRYHQYFSRARVDLLSDYRATMAEIATNEATMLARADELAASEAELVVERDALQSRRQAREQRLRALKSERADRIGERERLQADRRRLRDLLAELARRSETLAGREFAERAGALPWPVSGVVESRFGEPRAEGRLRWQGNFFSAGADTPVRAVHRGKVVFAEWLRGFGLLTIIDHGNEFMTLYGYADVLLKQPGDRVESGEQIATTGRSGGQDLDGLYFEVRKSGAAVDPATWLAPKSGAR